MFLEEIRKEIRCVWKSTRAPARASVTTLLTHILRIARIAGVRLNSERESRTKGPGALALYVCACASVLPDSVAR